MPPPSTTTPALAELLRRETRLSICPGKFHTVCRWLWLAVFGFTMRIRSAGMEETEGGMIVAVSHVSHLDPIVVSALFHRKISWVSRIEFYQQWFMRTALRHGGAFPVNRRGAALPTMREGLRRLARGEAVGIFPEGELTHGLKSVLRGGAIKQGVCLLAARSGQPVFPVVVLGTDQLGRLGPWLPAKRGKLWVKIGPPIYAEKHAGTRQGRADFAKQLTAEYSKLFTEMQADHGLAESILP